MPEFSLPQITLVLGGSASGKSAFAETLVVRTGRPRVYLATAQVYDTEMADKVSAHQAQRGDEWHTIEAPRDIAAPLAAVTADQIILLDCATLWLSNALLANPPAPDTVNDFMNALAACPAPVVVVSNEVGAGIVPDNALARAFRNAQGALNQAIAARAELVVNVIAGLPMTLKGDLP